jgi:cyclopropane fatty-acyl-phospholipid synthase-like methyltransferase
MTNIDEMYNLKFSNLNGVKSLGWGSEYSQMKRFEILIDINGYQQDDSVLDFGCGYGDLSSLIKNYEGIDIRETAIQIAKKKYPDKKFNHMGIEQINKKYDWIFASGVFCFKENWKNNFETTIKSLFNNCNKGISVNFLSELTNNTKLSDMKYAKIQDVINTIKNLSCSFTIRHDYLPNDFTLYLYKLT